MVSRLMEIETGIVLGEEKSYLLENRLSALARRLGAPSVHAVVEELRLRPTNQLVAEVIDAVATHETYFFRDPDVFRAFQEDVLPRLVAKRGIQRRLRFWSAAAASGQEAYSIAMACAEVLGQERAWRLEILATDISAAMVGRIKEASFDDFEVRRGLPPELLDRYFERRAKRWVARAEIRSAVQAMQLNLIAPWPDVGVFDAIFLRNVVVYFDDSSRQSVFDRCADALAPDGVLVTGTAESPLGLSERFEPDQTRVPNIYRLRADSQGRGAFPWARILDPKADTSSRRQP